MASPDPVPVTLVGGWYGAGKTTLLRAAAAHLGAGVAVIQGGFGDEVPGTERVVVDEEVGHRSPGCPCCALRLDLVDALDDLLTRRRPPRRILVELTGPADVLTAAQTVLDHPRVRARAELDRLVTVVDATTVAVRLANGDGPVPYGPLLDQLVAADVVVVSRLERLTSRAAELVGWVLHGLAPLARVEVAGLERAATQLGTPTAAFSAAATPAHLDRLRPHPAMCHGHHVRLDLPGLMDGERVDAWLSDLHAAAGARLLRFHASFAVQDDPAHRTLVRGVRATVRVDEHPATNTHSPCSRVLVVGHGLDRGELHTGLAGCIAKDGA
jgi:G3E family GTPase